MEIVTELLPEHDMERAVRIVNQGGVVAVRTETVYGLVVGLAHMNKMLAAKKSGSAKKIVMMFPDIEKLHQYFGSHISPMEKSIIEKFRGGLAVVLAAHNVAVRIPDDAVARKFLSYFDAPLLISSANITGEPAATTWQQVLKNMNGRVDAIIMSSPSRLGVHSSVVKVTGTRVEIIREGHVTRAELSKHFEVL